jgi:hypothetical protein
MSELPNVAFFLYAIAKVLILCGFLPGLALAILGERFGFRIVAFGVEQVRSESRSSRFEKRDGQLASEKSVRSMATSPSRNSLGVA